VAGLFENIRTNTQAISNMHAETSKSITGTVLPMLERLHKEIKAKGKELDSGAAKQSKVVDKARNASQKHIELFGQYTATFDSAGGKTEAAHDPYVLQRGIRYRLNQQISDENNNRNDLLAVQNGFQQFEAHVLTTVQNALGTFSQLMAGQADRQKNLFSDVAGTARRIPLDFEWQGFVKRHDNLLINPSAPPRSMSNVTWPNQDHRASKPLIEGSLERKGRGVGALGGYKSAYFAVTPAGYLHEFKDNDDFHKDPTPEMSLYLPDSTIGAVDGVRFQIKGKDVSGGKIGQKMHLSSEHQFKAHTDADAAQWHKILVAQIGKSTNSTPVSPVDSQSHSGAAAGAPVQHQSSIDDKLQQQPQGARQQEVPATAGTGPSTVPAESTTTSPSTMAPDQTSATAAPTTGDSAAEVPSGAPQSSQGQGSHFHGAPATTQLEERR
jgi:hypothetical protein